MNEKILERKILGSTLVQFLGKLIQLGLGIVSIKLLTTTLGTENYGLYGKISEFSLFFATAGNLGIFGNIVRKMAEAPRDSHLFWNALLLRMSTALFFFGIGLIYALSFIHDLFFFWGTLIFMGSLLLDYLTSVCDGALQVHYRMGRATMAILLGRTANLLLIYSFAQMGETNPAIYLLAPLFASFLTSSFSLFFVSRQLKLKGKWNLSTQKELLWTSLPFGIINLINSIYYRFLPGAIIAKTLSNNDYSTYNVGLHLASNGALLSTFLMFSVLPGLKQALKRADFQTAGHLYQKAKKTLAVLAIFLVAGGTFLGPPFITLVSNSNFSTPELWYFLPLLFLLGGVSYFYDLSFITLFALNQDRTWLKQELKTLAAVSVFFIAILWMKDATLKNSLSLIGAILAESAMAIWGMKRSEKMLSAPTAEVFAKK